MRGCSVPKKQPEEKVKLQKLRDIPPESFLSTGIEELDKMIGGGWPRKRISQVAGVPGSGKSYLLAKTMASMDGKALYVDTEFALNKDRLESLGVDLDKMDYLPSSKLEEVTTFIIDNVQDYDLIVIDTLARLTPMSVLENDMGTPPIALAARMISQFDALLRPKLFKSNCAVVGINQVRANMGYGQAETKAAGGFAWLHAIDLSLKIARKSNKTHSHMATIKIDKSRVGHPFKSIDIEVTY